MLLRHRRRRRALRSFVLRSFGIQTVPTCMAVRTTFTGLRPQLRNEKPMMLHPSILGLLLAASLPNDLLRSWTSALVASPALATTGAGRPGSLAELRTLLVSGRKGSWHARSRRAVTGATRRAMGTLVRECGTGRRTLCPGAPLSRKDPQVDLRLSPASVSGSPSGRAPCREHAARADRTGLPRPGY